MDSVALQREKASIEAQIRQLEADDLFLESQIPIVLAEIESILDSIPSQSQPSSE
jgi:hypothetical protein